MKRSIVKLLGIMSAICVGSSNIALASPTLNKIEVRADEGQTSGDWTYKIEGSSVTLTGYKGSGDTLDIPEKIDDKTVTRVDIDFTKLTSSFKTLKIPATVQHINNDFGIDGTEALSAKCFNSVNSIQCSNDGYYYCKDSALVYRASKDATENVLLFIPRNYNSFNVPDCITTIAKSAFVSLGAPETQILDNLQISKGVKNIEYDLFSESKINNIQINDQNDNLCFENNVFYSKDKKSLLKVLSCSDSTFTIDSSIENVGTRALANLSGITNIVIEGNNSTKTVFSRNALCLQNLATIELKSSNVNFESGALTEDNLPSFKKFVFTGSFTEAEKEKFNNAITSSVYEVTFVDDALNQIGEKQSVEKGKAAKAPEVPIKEGYEFEKWDTDFTNVTKNLVVKAVYKEAPKEFIVKFLDKDGKLIGKDQKVKEGEAATEPEVPDVEGYEFEKWDAEFDKVTEDLEVKAIYKEKEYLVKFLDKDGNQIGKDQKVKEGQAAIEPEAPDVEGYEFEKWDTEFNKVTEDLEVKAIYKQKQYLVKFLDKDGNQIGKDQKVNEGEAAIAPEVPDVDGYKFEKWDAEFDKVTKDLEIKAIYKEKDYTVKFFDKCGNQIGNDQKVKEGEAAKAPETPQVEGYEFSKWDVDFSKVTNNLEITAIYRKAIKEEFTVKFLDKDGNIIGEQQKVKKGEGAKAPEAPKVEGYEFEKWDTEYINVNKDLDIKAMYKEIQSSPIINNYTIKFLDIDGKQIGEKQVIKEGEGAKAPESPKVEGYEFEKWDTDYTNVTKDLQIKAIYKKVPVATSDPSPHEGNKPTGDATGFGVLASVIVSLASVFKYKKRNN